MATYANAGKAELANLCGNVSSPTEFTYLANGDGTGAESTTDTALGSEITGSGLARASATVTQVTTNVSNDTTQFYKQWTASGSETIAEVGAFNDASAGTMLLREKLSSSKSVTSGDTFTLTIKAVFA